MPSALCICLFLSEKLDLNVQPGCSFILPIGILHFHVYTLGTSKQYPKQIRHAVFFQTHYCYYHGYCYFCYSMKSMPRVSFKQLLHTQARTTHDKGCSSHQSQALLCPASELMSSGLSPVLSTSSWYLSEHQRNSPTFCGRQSRGGTRWLWGGSSPSPGPAPLHFTRVQAGGEQKGLEAERVFD